MNLSELPALGAGMGYRPPYHSELLWNRQEISVLEMTVEEFFSVSAIQKRDLDALSHEFPLLWHGIELSLGSTEPLSPDYLRRLTELIAMTHSPWFSEHLSFVASGGIEIGHLTPLPPTWESVKVVARNVVALQNAVGVPILLENITSVIDLIGEMTEWEFVREVLERTGAGLLLDVTNLYTNAVNREQNPQDELAQVPMERVVELHLAGGHYAADYLVDSHSHPIEEEVWSLTETTLKRADVKAIIIERDTNLPIFPEMLAEVKRAQHLWQSRGGQLRVA